MRILVIGAGATGGYYGGKLARAGRDVTFLVREKRAAQLRRTGLMVRTPTGEFTLTPQLIAAEELAGAGPFDLVLLSVKAYGLEESIEDFAPAVGARTMILPLLNGMRHIETLVARFGEEAVLGGSCRIVGDMDGDGRVIQMTPLNDLHYGERSAEVTERIRALDEQMKGADFDAVLQPDILRFMWVKWMMMAALNTINVLGRGSVGAVEAVQDLDGAGARFENRVMDEAIATATAYGYAPSESAERMIRFRVTEPGSTFESSLYRDYTRGYRVEALQIVGDMARRARAKGIDTPLLEAAYVQMRVYERERGW